MRVKVPSGQACRVGSVELTARLPVGLKACLGTPPGHTYFWGHRAAVMAAPSDRVVAKKPGSRTARDEIVGRQAGVQHMCTVV